MVYNAESNFLFVHIQKTGGTSITSALCQLNNSRFVRPPHLRLGDIRMPRRKPFVFAVVRNPWERLASWWHMMQRKQVHNDFSAYLLSPEATGEPVTFSTFIRRTDIIRENREIHNRPLWPVQRPWRRPHYLKSLGWNQEDYLMRGGRFAADAVLRFEHLEEDWEGISPRLDSGTNLLLPHENASSIGERSSWRTLYEKETDVDFVAHQFARDIQRWKYDFN